MSTNDNNGSIRLEQDHFYLVTVDGERTIHLSKDTAIDSLGGQELNPEETEVSIVEVSVGGDEWGITELPWRDIALRLLGGSE